MGDRSYPTFPRLYNLSSFKDRLVGDFLVWSGSSVFFSFLLAYCNDLDPPLADIVLFGLSLSGFPSKLLKHVC